MSRGKKRKNSPKQRSARLSERREREKEDAAGKTKMAQAETMARNGAHTQKTPEEPEERRLGAVAEGDAAPSNSPVSAGPSGAPSREERGGLPRREAEAIPRPLEDEENPEERPSEERRELEVRRSAEKGGGPGQRPDRRAAKPVTQQQHQRRETCSSSAGKKAAAAMENGSPRGPDLVLSTDSDEPMEMTHARRPSREGAGSPPAQPGSGVEAAPPSSPAWESSDSWPCGPEAPEQHDAPAGSPGPRRGESAPNTPRWGSNPPQAGTLQEGEGSLFSVIPGSINTLGGSDSPGPSHQIELLQTPAPKSQTRVHANKGTEEDSPFHPLNNPGSKPQGESSQKLKVKGAVSMPDTQREISPSSLARAQLSKYAYQPKAQDLAMNPSPFEQRVPPHTPTPPSHGSTEGGTNTTPTGNEKISPLLMFPDLKLLFQSIPTKDDLARTESNIRSDIKNIQEQVDAVSARVSAIETHNDNTDSRLAEVIEAQSALRQELAEQRAQHQVQISLLHNHLDDLENRHRRNNLRIRGLPEAVGRADLKSTVVNIFNSVLGHDHPREITIDRVHRSLGPPAVDPARPRDIICRLHYYTVKEDILRKAWEAGRTEWEGTQIQIFPDVSKRTLQMRRVLKPLLARIKEVGASYRWGFPFQLSVRKNGATFLLRAHEDLGDLFNFLDTNPFPVPNWQEEGGIAPQRRAPPRGAPQPQRARRQRPRDRPNRDEEH